MTDKELVRKLCLTLPDKAKDELFLSLMVDRCLRWLGINSEEDFLEQVHRDIRKCECLKRGLPFAEYENRKTFFICPSAEGFSHRIRIKDRPAGRSLPRYYCEDCIFEVSKYYDYGKSIVFGDFSFQPIHTPGHTPGCTSFYITVNGEETLHLGLHGGLGLNGLSLAELEENNLPSSLQREYLSSLESVYDMPVDIVLPSHLSHYPGDYMALVAQNKDGSGDSLRIPDAWKRLIESRITQIKKLIEQDQHETSASVKPPHSRRRDL